MRKAWLVFLLVTLISAQLVVLPSFHDIESGGIANGNSVVGIAKWNYVQGLVRVSVSPIVQNASGTGNVQIVLPNGTTKTIVSSYSFALRLPKTGDSFGNGAISGPLALSQGSPMNVTLFQNVGNVPDYVNTLRGSLSNSLLPIDIYVIVIHGDAQVEISGYGMGL